MHATCIIVIVQDGQEMKLSMHTQTHTEKKITCKNYQLVLFQEKTILPS
jgi:hypothetical protein